VLETSFVTFRTPRWHRSFRKRVIKAPKLHFVDSGLACYLLGIREPEQLQTHPQRGALFESWVAAEILKARLHRGLEPDLHHLRETRGIEVDLLVEAGEILFGVEMKSGATVASGFTDDLRELGGRIEREAPHLRYEPRLVYGGDQLQARGGVSIVPWSQVAELSWGA
jgi:predicted AAA+ superfamily ATPase